MFVGEKKEKEKKGAFGIISHAIALVNILLNYFVPFWGQVYRAISLDINLYSFDLFPLMKEKIHSRCFMYFENVYD